MKNVVLPPCFNDIAGEIFHVQYKGGKYKEFSSTCPQCKDFGHDYKKGLPDRFVLVEVSKKYGIPFGWCRRCGYTWSSTRNKKPSREEIEEWKKYQLEVEKSKLEAAERAIELLQEEKEWEKFYKQHNEWSMYLLKKRGFRSEKTIEYLQIGFCPEYEVWYMDDSWHKYLSPAHSIPIWTIGNKVSDIKMRVLNPENESRDRYRSYGKTGVSNLYIPCHDLDVESTALIVEGEFKAGIVFEHLDTTKISTVGVQSKSPNPEVFDAIKNCDPVYLCLDPDAFIKEAKNGESAVERMTRLLGKERVLIVDLPCKPDDGINKGMQMRNYLRMARKA